MPATIDCPICGRMLRWPDELATATVQCPDCATTFPADRAASLTTAVSGPASEPLVKPLRSVETAAAEALPACGSGQHSCPYCREAVFAGDAFCRHCGEGLVAEEGSAPPWERSGALRRDVEPHRGTLVLTIGAVGLIASGIHVLSVLGVPLSVAAWLMGASDLQRMRSHQLDPSGVGLTQAGRICGIIGTCLGLLWWLVGALLLAVNLMG